MSLSTFGQSILFSCLFLAGARVQAAPVTYTFTGTLQQPYDGSTSFSGTLVYNTDLPTYPGITPSPGWAYYSAVPSDPTAPVSSLTFQFGNTPSSALGTVDSLEVVVNHNSASDGFFIQEQFSGFECVRRVWDEQQQSGPARAVVVAGPAVGTEPGGL